MIEDIAGFIEILESSIQGQSFVKLTLGKPSSKAGLSNVYVRTVQIRKGTAMSFTYRYARRDEVKNYAVAEGVAKIIELLTGDFLSANLFTLDADVELMLSRNGHARLRKRPSTFIEIPAAAHDRKKNRFVAEDRPYLAALGLATTEGKIKVSGVDKYKQINKFIEVIEDYIKDWGDRPLRAIDMGCGKGYLTFALYDYLTVVKGIQTTVTGVDQNQELVSQSNHIAQVCKMEGLVFCQDTIGAYQPTGQVDAVIALHACDTATDDAIANAVAAGASLIVVAPCCHNHIRKQFQPEDVLQPVVRHGILAERQAELLTDAIRALLMESQGYKVKVFEFISTEHTGKNVMITAVKNGSPDANALLKVEELKQLFGVEEHYLEGKLKKR